MAVVICPWCQSEIMQEEGQEPDKICPVCDNELDGYRTLKLNVGGADDQDYEDEDDEDEEPTIVSINDDTSWEEVDSFNDASDEELLQFEETVEQLLNEQELVPECPLCHEYMIECGEQLISANQFRHRVTDVIGEDVIEAPFTLTMYLCPSCFSVHSFLGDSHRLQVVRRLSQDPADRNGKGRGV
ncbi:hypothetical protein [Cohnella silvisoli]|uniref:Uncharacterized protein n=1 Tax=Cohnella silvisoli TaxID=2873699 RepID=A0ABV1KXH9_9BACL|nr:hypothetical protein [Cohnella silvisoli]MCD9024212.1 hypothetical protein [Cohnella silvisoli]